MALNSSVWIVDLHEIGPVSLSSFSSSLCFLASYLDYSYFTCSTMWIVNLHEIVLASGAPPYPSHQLLNLSGKVFNTFACNSHILTTQFSSSILSFQRETTLLSLYLDGEKKLRFLCNFFDDDLGGEEGRERAASLAERVHSATPPSSWWPLCLLCLL